MWSTAARFTLTVVYNVCPWGGHFGPFSGFSGFFGFFRVFSEKWPNRHPSFAHSGPTLHAERKSAEKDDLFMSAIAGE